MWNQKSKYSRIVGIHELPVGDKSLLKVLYQSKFINTIYTGNEQRIFDIKNRETST